MPINDSPVPLGGGLVRDETDRLSAKDVYLTSLPCLQGLSTPQYYSTELSGVPSEYVDQMILYQSVRRYRRLHMQFHHYCH